MTAVLHCAAPISDETLIEYWIDELDEAATARVDEHILGCAECSERLATIVALADGTRDAFVAGATRAFVTEEFVAAASAQGLRLREYRVPVNGSVNCSVAPEDDVVVSRLEAPLEGVTRLDAITYLNDDEQARFTDIPFNAASGLVVMTPKVSLLRAEPAHRRRFRLVAVDDHGECVIGDYTFNHSAHVAR